MIRTELIRKGRGEWVPTLQGLVSKVVLRAVRGKLLDLR